MSNKGMKRPVGMGGGHGRMGMGQEKARDFKGTVKKLINYLSPYKCLYNLYYHQIILYLLY